MSGDVWATALRFDIEGLLCAGLIVAVVVAVSSSRRVSTRCPRCQEINRPSAVFCAQCGTRLPGR